MPNVDKIVIPKKKPVSKANPKLTKNILYKDKNPANTDVDETLDLISTEADNSMENTDSSTPQIQIKFYSLLPEFKRFSKK